MVPKNREEFKERCLRKLGAGAIEINVTRDQVEDAVDEALQWYWDYHFDGSEKTYFRYDVTDVDRENGYITLPDNVMGAVRVFDAGTLVGAGASNVNTLAGMQWQMTLSELWSYDGISLVPYYLTMTNLSMIDMLLRGESPIEFSRHTNRLYLNTNWGDRFSGSSTLIVEAYRVLDPDVYPDVWNDRWLTRYATCLIKKVWGNNLKKFTGMKLPGGLMFSGQLIYDEAVAEQSALESEMLFTYSLPAYDAIG